MNNSEGLKSFQQSLAGLPQWVSERILQQINQLTHYEPVIGIMGKSGAAAARHPGASCREWFSALRSSPARR